MQQHLSCATAPLLIGRHRSTQKLWLPSVAAFIFALAPPRSQFMTSPRTRVPQACRIGSYKYVVSPAYGPPVLTMQWMLWHVFRYRDGRGELHRADRLGKTEDGDRAPPPPLPPTSGASWTSPLTTLWLTCQMWELANVVLSISIPCEESTGMD